jgi:CRISPR-associated endonuclease Cas2
MALQRHLYLICYDISEDPKRLARVARYLSKFAFRVQYSVFVGSFFDHSLEGVLRGLEESSIRARMMCVVIPCRIRRKWC